MQLNMLKFTVIKSILLPQEATAAYVYIVDKFLISTVMLHALNSFNIWGNFNIRLEIMRSICEKHMVCYST